MLARLNDLKPNSDSPMAQHITSVNNAKNHILAHVAFCMRNSTNPLEAETKPTWVVNWRKAVNIRAERWVDRIIISYPLVLILKDFIEDTDSFKWPQWQIKLAQKYNITNLWTVYRIARKLWCIELLEWKHINLSVESFERIKAELDSNIDNYIPSKSTWNEKKNGEWYISLMEKLWLTNPEYLYSAVSALWLAEHLGFSKIKITSLEKVHAIRREMNQMIGGNHGHFTELEILQITEAIGLEEKDAWRVSTVIRAFWFIADNIIWVEKV